MIESYIHKGITRWREVPDPVAAPKRFDTHTPYRQAMGQILREKRMEMRLNLRDIQGVSLGFVSEVERGKKEPSSEILQALCDNLNLTVADVLRLTADRMENKELISA